MRALVMKRNIDDIDRCNGRVGLYRCDICQGGKVIKL